MKKITMITMVVCLLLAGCETEQKKSQYQSVSEEIEQVKAEAAAQEQAASEQRQATELTGNIKVTVRILTVEERDYEALDSLWGYTTGSFVAKRRPDLFPESGLKVHIAGGDLSGKLTAVKEQVKHSEETQMFLVLADGTTGYINVGTEIAVPRFYYLTRWYEATEYDFIKAGRGFKVFARKVPQRELINLQFVPVLSHFLNNGGDKEFTELGVNVTVAPGQSILIGGSRTSTEDLSSALLGLKQEKTLKDTVILVNASLM